MGEHAKEIGNEGTRDRYGSRRRARVYILGGTRGLRERLSIALTLIWLLDDTRHSFGVLERPLAVQPVFLNVCLRPVVIAASPS